MWPCRPCRVSLRIVALTLFVMVPVWTGAWAQNENETVGFQTNHMFESGTFGESLDVLNGGLTLEVPIGQRYVVTPTLGYGLTLSYGSKIWRADGITGANKLVRQGPFGLGFNLNLGRIYRDVAQTGTNTSECKWYFVTQDGNEHPFVDQSPFLPCDSWPFDRTTDTTYYGFGMTSATGWDGSPATAPTMTISAPNGTVYEFGHLVQVYDGSSNPVNSGLDLSGGMSDAVTRYNRDFGGWYVTKITSIRSDSAGNFVTVSYRTTLGYEHVISTITDSLERVSTFTSSCQPAGTPSGCVETLLLPNAANRAAVRTTAISVPRYVGNTSVMAGTTNVYNFNYEWRSVTSQFTGQTPVTYGPVNFLTSIDYPLVTNHALSQVRYQMTFAYDFLPPGSASPIIGGEMVKRVIPTGASIAYAWGDYGYLAAIPGSARTGVSAVAHHVTSKTVTLAGEPNPAVWLYTREAVESGTLHTNPKYVVVTDPLDNDTTYRYRASRTQSGNSNNLSMNPEDDWAPEWDDGVNYLIEYYQGKGASRRLIRTEIRDYDADLSTYGGRGKLNARTSRQTTTHIDDSSRTSTVGYRSWDNMGHWLVEVASADGIAEQRTTRSLYGGSDPERFLYREISEGTRVVSRTENQYDTYGRVALVIDRMTLPAQPGTGVNPAMPVVAGDVLTKYTYDGAGRVTQKEIGDQGLGGGGALISPKYRIGYTWQAGGYLAAKEFTDWLTGTYYTWKAIDRERDGNTGLIFTSSDSAEQATHYSYDELGRLKDITPPAAENPTQIEYVNILKTTVRQGDPAVMGGDYECSGGAGDYIMACYEYDTLGRLIKTTKRPYDLGRGFPYQKVYYNNLGLKTFESEWLWPGDPETGTTYDYADPFDASQKDPFGRVRKITTADHTTLDPKTTVFSYSGMNSSVTVQGIVGPTGTTFNATTSYERDPWGRLVAVYAPVPATGGTESYKYGGGDAFYSYDVRDNLVAVEIVNRANLFHQGRSFEFDPLNRLRTSYNPEGGTQSVTGYDPLGSVTEATDASGNRLLYTYDGAGRLLTVKRQDYQKSGAPTPRIDSLLENKYDEGGAFGTYSAGRLTTTISWDDADQAVAWVGGNQLVNTVERYYNHASGRVTHERSFFTGWSPSEAVPTVYAYNQFGQLDTLTYPEGPAGKGGAFALNYKYSNGMPVEVWDLAQPMPPIPGAQAQARVTYNAAGGLEDVITFGQVRTLVDPDARNRPGSINVGRWDGSTFTEHYYQSGSYDYDAAGNIAQIGANVYGYDAANRLVRASTVFAGTTRKQTFSYDDFGNMTQKDLYDLNDQLLQTDIYTVTNQTSGYTNNRLLNHQIGVSMSTYAYDPRGNVTRGDGRTFDIDNRNRVSTVWSTTPTTQSEVARYRYDGSSQRVIKEDFAGDLVSFYARDGQGRLMSEFRRTRSGSYTPEWVKHYLYIGDRLIGLRENTVPAPPGRITATVNRPEHKVFLTWSAPPQGEGYTVASYKVYRAVEAQTPVWGLLGAPTSTTYTDTTATNNVTYRYLVSALDTLGNEGNGSGTLVLMAGDIQRPDPPTGLVGTAGDKKADLSWAPNNAVELIVGYHVYRATGAGSPVKITQTPVPRSFYRGQGLTNGVSYRFSIAAVDSATNESVKSDEVIVVPQDFTPPDAPRNVRVTADCAGGSTVTLTWDASYFPEPLDYTVFRTPAFPGGPSDLALTNSYTDLSATPGATYTYTVKAVDAGGNLSRESLPAKVTTRMGPATLPAPTKPPGTLVENGKVTLKASFDPGVSKVRVYRKRNVDQSCDAYEYLDDLPSNGVFPDSGVTNGMAWDYALSNVNSSDQESQFSTPTLAMPVAAPQGVTRCIEELPAWADGAKICSPTGQATPWRRQVLRWADPPIEAYQPYRDHSEGPLGFLKGVRLYRFQGAYGTSSSDKSTLVPLLDDYDKGYCPSIPDRVCSGYGSAPASSVCPGSETCAVPSDGATHDGYGQCSNDSAKLCMVDSDCASGDTCSFPPVDPMLLMYGDARFNGQFFAAPGFGNTCLAARAVYKVFANGTWLTVESDLSDMLSKSWTADPSQRCNLWWADVCGANLTPDAFAPAPNTLVCPSPSTLPQVPPAPTATIPSAGVITVSWLKPKAGICQLATPASCASSACASGQYCSATDGFKCRLSATPPTACDTSSECPGTPVRTCSLNLARDISAWRLYVTEVDADRHHFVRAAPVVLTFDAATTSHTFTGLSHYLRSGAVSQFVFRVATVDGQGRVSEPSDASPTVSPTEAPDSIKPPASLKQIIWTTNDAGRDNRGALGAPAHPRDLDGIKLAWKDGYSILGGVLGYRVWRLTPQATWCALLQPGTPQDPNPPGVTLCTNELTSLPGDPNAYSTQYTTGPSGSNRVYVDKTVYAGNMQSYSVSAVTSVGEALKSASITAISMPHPSQPLSPPAYLQASAPSGVSEWKGVYLTWCRNNTLEGVTKYKVYRSTGVANRTGPFTFLAEIDPTCLDAGKRCEIKTVGSSVQPSGSCTPGIGGTCEVVDKTVAQPPFGEDYPTQVSTYTHNYVVTAVRPLGGGGIQESAYSAVNSGWPNYCGNGNNCEKRYDPDNTRPIPCGDETARLESPEPLSEQPEASMAEVNAGSELVGLAPYRIIGQGSGLPTSPNAVVRFVYYHLDHLGTPRVITDATGDDISMHHYMPFGEEMPAVAQGTTNKKQYTGHERDAETGMDYMMARYASSSLARFMAPDPLQGSTSPSHPQTWNRYTYVLNSPIRLVDPRGTDPRNILQMAGVSGPSSGPGMARGLPQNSKQSGGDGGGYAGGQSSGNLLAAGDQGSGPTKPTGYDEYVRVVAQAPSDSAVSFSERWKTWIGMAGVWNFRPQQFPKPGPRLLPRIPEPLGNTPFGNPVPGQYDPNNPLPGMGAEGEEIRIQADYYHAFQLLLELLKHTTVSITVIVNPCLTGGGGLNSCSGLPSEPL